MQQKSDTNPAQRKREERLSKDQEWRSFPKVPCLLQYVSSGVYYARFRINGKLIRQSLETMVWTDAKLLIAEKQKELRAASEKIGLPSFREAVEEFKKELERDTAIKPQSKRYRLWCLRCIEKSWPQLWNLNLDQIAPEECKDWAVRLNKQIASHYFNNTIATLRLVLDSGIRVYEQRGGKDFKNPASDLKRTRVKQKELKLPEPSQFRNLVQNLRLKSGGWGPRIGDLVEFLAYSGMRIHSEAVWVTWEDIDWQRKQIVVRGSPETGTKNTEIRRIPMVEDMERLLKGLKTELGTGNILQISHCNAALTRACKEIGISRITHHDLRHLFATRCIESGVDIPTVSRWLGHKDGGALAMKTYGHLRNEHSQAMAQKVKF